MPPIRPNDDEINQANSEVCQLLKKCRIEANLTQVDLSRMSGVTQQAVANYEVQERISMITLCRVASVLKLKLSITSESSSWTYN